VAESRHPGAGREGEASGDRDPAGRDRLPHLVEHLSALRVGRVVPGDGQTPIGRTGGDVPLRRRLGVRLPVPGGCRAVLPGFTEAAGSL